MESNSRFFRRRANEELSAADRAVTPAARARRMQLAGAFLQRLKEVEAEACLSEREMQALTGVSGTRPVFEWAETAPAERI